MKLISTLLFIASLISLALGKYNYVYMIRHGEKVSDADFGLSQIGLDHLHCLADHYFESFPMGAPKYAITKISTTDRPAISATIIANRLNIPILSLPSQKVSKIASSILDKLNEFHRVLVVWENNEIPTIAQALGCKQCRSWNYDPISKIHDAQLFNSTWVLRFPVMPAYDLKSMDKLNFKFTDYDQNYLNGTCHSKFVYKFRSF
jgi:hypothetical protein